MLESSLPLCPCGHFNYRSGGAHIGPDRSSQWFFCEECGRPVLTIADAGVVHLLTASLTPKLPLSEFPQEGLDWANTILNVHIADRNDRYSTAAKHWAKTFAWDAVCDEQGFPHGTTVGWEALPEEERTAGHNGVNFLQDVSETKIPETTDQELVDKFRDRWRDLERACPFSPGTRLPPHVPECLSVRVGFYVSGLGENVAWSPLVSHTETKDIPIPEDPRRRKNLEFWKGVFDELRGKGYAFSEPEETQNCYWKDSNKTEPWFTFTHGKTGYLLGPRKRVYSIHMRKGTRFPLKRQTAVFGKLGKRDKVTYEVGNDDALIHAWGRDKLIEYLTAAMEA